ncbi:MAG: STAS domain-containing protein [Saprospiraceae bacterium]|nr:STAS domain-containing protein [Saprospiraceae bacterium]
MRYSVDKQEKFTIFSLHDENLNSILAPSLKAQFSFMCDEGISNLILDLNDVKYVDSSGLSAILLGDKVWKKTGGSFILTNLNPAVKKLIEIAKLDSVLTIIPTIEECKEYILMEEIEKELNGESDS